MSKLPYQRLDDLLEILVKQADYVPISDFTKRFGVSARTIRTDITNLNDTLKTVGATVQLARNKGYLLQISDKTTFSTWYHAQLTSDSLPLASSEDRQAFLFFTLVKRKKPLSLDEFLEQLFVSKNTFYSYLKTIRDLLLPYGIKIVNRPNIGFTMVGHEFYQRQAISEHLIVKDLQEYLTGFTEMELALFDTIDLELLQKLEMALLKPLELMDSDYYHKNILSHFALALSRIVDGKELTTLPVKVPRLKKEAQHVLNIFLAELEDAFKVSLTDAEKDYFLYYLSINAPRLVETTDNHTQSRAIADKIVTELLASIKKDTNYHWLTDTTLLKDLTSHIEGFITMDLLDAGRKNPLLETIQTSFPLAYDLCLTSLKTIGENHGFYFSEDEIGYIALHIAGAMERNSSKQQRKYRVILVCGTGRAMSRIIEAKINKHYQETIDIVKRVSFMELQQQNLTEVDVLLTTVPLEKMSIPYLYIHMGQLDKDIEKIGAFLDKLASQTATIYDLFREDAFLYNPSVTDKQQLLKQMSETLVEEHIVPDAFYQSVWTREKISQTNINQVLAIPHPMTLTAYQSVISVALLPNGLDWGGGETVTFVFMFAITKEDYEHTDEIYTLLLDLLDKPDCQKRLLHSSDFPSFLERLKEI